jgi:hypothetical protein
MILPAKARGARYSAAIGAFLLSLAPAFAQKPEVVAQARALLDRAASVTHYRSRDSAPFKFRGRFRIGSNPKKSTEGTYVLSWVSPDKWREEIVVGGVSRIRVGEPGWYWQVQEIRTELFAIHRASDLLNVRVLLQELQRETLRGVSKKKKKGRERVCIKAQSDFGLERELCLDAASHLPVSESSQSAFYSGSLEYEFRLVGSSWFPQFIRRKENGQTVIEFSLDEVREAPVFDDAHFARPAGAEGWPSCENPVPSRPARPSAALRGASSQTQVIRLPDSGTMLVYAIVGLDGKLHNVQVVYSTFKNPPEDRLRRLMEGTHEPARCDGKPIGSEQFITLGTGNLFISSPTSQYPP